MGEEHNHILKAAMVLFVGFVICVVVAVVYRYKDYLGKKSESEQHARQKQNGSQSENSQATTTTIITRGGITEINKQ